MRSIKKTWILHSVLLSFLISSCNTNKIDIINANSNQASIKIDDYLYGGNWNIVPEVSPDVFPVEIPNGKTVKVSFITDLDSLSYQIKLGQKQDFYVILNDQDSAFTRFEGVPSKVNFTQEYIKNNKGKWSVEIIEAQELFQVISVITPTGLSDTRSMIINHDSTTYYKEVLAHFLPFKTDPIVASIDSLLQKNWYINLKADACALIFDTNDNLGKSNTYDRMRGGSNLLDPYLTDLNDFARKTKFREFYRNHQGFYDSLINWHEKAIPTKKQWEWLETQFPDHKYDNYRITFSPLVKGNHSTVRFNNNGFKQAIMFIRPPYIIKNVNEKVSEGLITRMVFTEIDHNYVNPESDKYIERINMAFADREKWTAGKESKGYKTPYAIFNEYMTWSVYLLYCYDQFNEADFKVINDRIVNYIINRRGFQRFNEFHGTLLNLYATKNSKRTVADLYQPLLDWAESFDL
jgi:hypothetical protein